MIMAKEKVNYQEVYDLYQLCSETKDLREWIGVDYDPARFDRQAANAAIKRLLWNHWIK